MRRGIAGISSLGDSRRGVTKILTDLAHGHAALHHPDGRCVPEDVRGDAGELGSAGCPLDRTFDALDLVAVPFDDVFGEGALLCGQKLLSEIVVQRDSCTPFFGAVSLRIIKLNRPTLKVHSVPCEVQDRAGPTGGVEGE